MNFTSKQLRQYETVAEIFSATRREKGLELERVEKATKVSKKYLLALETGQYNLLPGSVYAKNFARSYASYLGLDVKKISKLIDRELEITTKLTQPKTVKGTDYATNKILLTPKIIRNTIVSVLAAACLLYFAWQINAIFSPPYLQIISPQPDLVTSQNLITIEGQTIPGAQVSINGQEILADQTGHFIKPVDLQVGLNTIQIQAKKKRSQPRTETRQVMVTQVEVIDSNPATPPNTNVPPTNQPAQ